MTDVVLNQKAEEYANNKADKGNYDYAVGDNVYFCKSALEQAYKAGYNEAKKGFQAEMEYAETHCFFSDDCTQIENLKKATALLRSVIEWADSKSGSEGPSFNDIEKDIKAFLE